MLEVLQGFFFFCSVILFLKSLEIVCCNVQQFISTQFNTTVTKQVSVLAFVVLISKYDKYKGISDVLIGQIKG